jgi:hypothetical protein
MLGKWNHEAKPKNYGLLRKGGSVLHSYCGPTLLWLRVEAGSSEPDEEAEKEREEVEGWGLRAESRTVRIVVNQ